MESKEIWMEKMEDFKEKVFTVLREKPQLKIGESFAVAAKMPAKRFYVSFLNACRFVSMIDRGQDLPLKNENKIAMYRELHKRWSAYREERRAAGQMKVTSREMVNVISQPAPQFYEDVETLRCAFYKYLREKRNK